MKHLQTFALILLIVASGCIATPFDRPIDQERPVEFIAENRANTTHTFAVFVVQRPANVSYTLSDGRSGRGDIDQSFWTHDPGDNRTYTRVEPPESARLHGRFVVSPGESNRSSIPDPPWNAAVVVVVYQDEHEIMGYTTGNCDDEAMAYLRVTRQSRDSVLSNTFTCV